ncbi:hypothetical protein [Curtobacterium sp. MCJR17_020]|uniref:hypothetical protein n=1 Tax=Curtobacterium sp. MCJR17_020 TaxID=2175619 RepID=UPI0015E8A5A8|nr:hypothetical protein [Curtobacterium sp. MCJR17_020]WIE72321.1 hypothetical protein DEJ14_000760 [Curtobacterium sp. MCJR17_020]
MLIIERALLGRFELAVYMSCPVQNVDLDRGAEFCLSDECDFRAKVGVKVVTVG